MITRAKSIGRKIPILGAAILAVLALSAIGSSAAQAFEYEVDGYLVSELGGSVATTGSSSSLELSGTVAGAPFQVSCKATSSGKIMSEGTGETTISASGCTAIKPVGCVVPNLTIKAKTELYEVGGVLYERYVPINGPGTNFTTLKLEECASVGNYPIRGSFAGQNNSYTTPQEAQTLEYSAASSKAVGAVLTVGPNAATATGALSQEVSWGIEGWGVHQPAAWGHLGKEWLIDGKTMTEAGLTSETVASNLSPVPFKFAMLISGAEMKFSCSMKYSGTISKGGTGTAAVKLSSCVSEVTGCKVPASNSFNALKTSITEVGGKSYVKFEPAVVGGNITSFVIEGCVLSGAYAIKGSFSGLTEAPGTELTVQPLQFSLAIDNAAGTGMKAGSWVTLAGSQNVSLTGNS